MAHRGYREASKIDWGTSETGGLTIEQITVGALLRIADATELMARRYQELIDERDRLKLQLEREQKANEHLTNSIRSYKGVITKQKTK